MRTDRTDHENRRRLAENFNSRAGLRELPGLHRSGLVLDQVPGALHPSGVPFD